MIKQILQQFAFLLIFFTSDCNGVASMQRMVVTPPVVPASGRGYDRSFDSKQSIVAVEGAIGDSRTAEAALFQAIMGNYRSNVRPVRNVNETVYVSTRLFPIKIQTLKERDEVLSLTLRLQLGWSDLSLVWNPADYGGLDKIVVNAYDLWLPDLQIANSAEDMYQLMRDRQFAVKIHHNGEIWYHPTGSVKVRCELDLRYFPFDLQRCPITLESVIHTVQQLNLTVRQDRPPISFSMYTENGVWEMVLATGHTSSYYVSANTAFSRVNFLLYLHRRTSYYKLNIIFPCAMLSGLQLLTFLLPLNNQERVPQSTTILLSVVVFQTVVVEELPRTSNSLSLLSLYISLLTGISVASVADSVAIAYLISLRDRAFQVPRWFAVFLRVICRHKSVVKHSPIKPVDLFNNSRSSLIVKSSIVTDPFIKTDVPLAYVDDYNSSGDVNNNNSNNRYGHNRTWSPNRNANKMQNRSRSHHQIVPPPLPGAVVGGCWNNQNGQHQQYIANKSFNCHQKLDRFSSVANNYIASSGNGSIGNNSANNDDNLPVSTRVSPLLPQKRHHSNASSRKNSQQQSIEEAQQQLQQQQQQQSTACLYALRSGHEVVFVRWYKVARIINAVIFIICLLLITFVPVILFIWMPPDVSQYKYFQSTSAASPPIVSG